MTDRFYGRAARTARGGVAGAALVTLALVALSVASPSEACACTTKMGAVLGGMKGELRNIARFQHDFFADSGRMASRDELEALGWAWSPYAVELSALDVTDSTLHAVTTSPSYAPGGSCTLDLRAADLRIDPYAEGTLSCAGLPDPGRTERRVTLIYAVLFAMALMVRVAVAGRSQPPVTVVTVLGMLAFATIHPFWFLVGTASWCDQGVAVAYLWFAFLGAYILRTAFFGTYSPPGTRPPPAPAAPSPPDPR